MMELSYAPSPRLIDPLARVQAALAGRYTIERELGRGGMAAVYLAQDRKHHRPVAIKVLKPELAAALGPERFLREIDTAARLTHPHILPLHDSGEAAGLRSEEHTSELQSPCNLVCRLLLEKKNIRSLEQWVSNQNYSNCGNGSRGERLEAFPITIRDTSEVHRRKYLPHVFAACFTAQCYGT